VICGFCHREIPEKVGAPDGEERCGGCLGGCRKIHCPHCGYSNPAPGKILQRFLGKKKGETDG